MNHRKPIKDSRFQDQMSIEELEQLESLLEKARKNTSSTNEQGLISGVLWITLQMQKHLLEGGEQG